MRHLQKASLVRCSQCGAWAASFSTAPGCPLGEADDEARMCRSMRIKLLEAALRRAILPDAFDKRMRIKPGLLGEVLDAESRALRQVAALLGPVGADLKTEDGR